MLQVLSFLTMPNTIQTTVSGSRLRYRPQLPIARQLHRVPLGAISVGGYLVVIGDDLALARILAGFSRDEFKTGIAAHIVFR